MACMLSTESECWSQIIAGYNNAFGYAQLAESYADDAYIHMLLNEDRLMNTAMINSLHMLVNGLWTLAYPYNDCDPKFAVPFYLKNYAVTWQKIVESWSFNNFEGRMPTIAFIDRMRQLLWDEPYFVAWAAEPETNPNP